MAALSDMLDGLSINDVHLKDLGLDDSLQTKLNKIKNNFETIFSWDIKEETGNNENLLVNVIDKTREKLNLHLVNDDNLFNLYRFYLKLIISYELYINGNLEESLLEIQSVVELVQTSKFDKSNNQYLEPCNHIARTSNAYIALTMNLDFEKIIEFVKPVKHLSEVEKAAIKVIKAKVFMEYPPKGNNIALTLAEQACELHPTDTESLITWLKAKGRVRRFDSQHDMPTPNELSAAKRLSSNETEFRSLIEASAIYSEAAFIQKLQHNNDVSKANYNISSELILKAINLAEDKIELLYYCLQIYIILPIEYHFKAVIDKVINKLTNVRIGQVDQVLGEYYLKYEKDYEKAKIHLSRGMAGGNFKCSLKLIKVECLIKPVTEYPIVQSLNMIYDVFNSPKRRLIILSQLLMYFYYIENNPKEMMRYLKLYMDQDIDDTIKLQNLMCAFPLFKFHGYFRVKDFVYGLATKVGNITKLPELNTDEKVLFVNTYQQYSKLLNIKNYSRTFYSKNNSNNLNKGNNNKKH